MRIIAILTILWTLFAIPSSAITLSFQSLFSALRGEAVVESSLEHFWVEAQKLGPKAGQVVLNAATKAVAQANQAITSFKDGMDDIVIETKKIRAELNTFLEDKNITIEHLSDMLTEEIGGAYEELRDEIVDPLPQERNERAKARAQLVGRALQKVDKAYIRAMVKLGVPSEQADEHIHRVSPKIEHVLLVTGNIVDDYPILLDTMIFAASMLLLPEIQILRPIMSFFGFGPLGPIKGSTAAWLQSRFWGGFVKSGSWFAILQKVGMTLTGSWVQRVIANAGLAAVLGLVIHKTARFCS